MKGHTPNSESDKVSGIESKIGASQSPEQTGGFSPTCRSAQSGGKRESKEKGIIENYGM